MENSKAKNDIIQLPSEENNQKKENIPINNCNQQNSDIKNLDDINNKDVNNDNFEKSKENYKKDDHKSLNNININNKLKEDFNNNIENIENKDLKSNSNKKDNQEFEFIEHSLNINDIKINQNEITKINEKDKQLNNNIQENYSQANDDKTNIIKEKLEDKKEVVNENDFPSSETKNIIINDIPQFNKQDNNKIFEGIKKEDNLNRISNIKISNDKLNQNNKEDENDDSSDSGSSDSNYENNSFNNITKKVCGIENLGNNCYLNSGLQIFASCEELINLFVQENNKKLGDMTLLFKQAMNKLLNHTIYNPEKFIDHFCKINRDFEKGSQCCSQSFMRTLITNINKEYTKNKYDLVLENKQYPKIKNKEYNEYEKYVANIYPESKAQSIFSVLTKSHSEGICPHCKEKIDNYSYNFFIDQIMYLDDLEDKCKFSDVLKSNLGNYCNLTMGCPNPKCKEEIEVQEKTKIIKLPEILIFTLERYQGEPNKVEIEPDDILEMSDYIDESLSVESTKYELFAINIRFGSTIDFGHEICQVKREGKWYEINDSTFSDKKNSHFDSSYGLFYRRIKSTVKDKNYINKQLPILTTKKIEINWFRSALNFLSTKLFDKIDFNSIIQIKQAIYILIESNTFTYLLSTFEKQKINIINMLKEVIFKIKNENIYDVNDFINELLKNKSNYKNIKQIDLIDFIKLVLTCINDEYIKNKFFLYTEKELNYSPVDEPEKIEFNKCVKNKYPLSKPLDFFIGINKVYTKGKCECGKNNKEYEFNDFFNIEISTNNKKPNSTIINILKEKLKEKKHEIICMNCNKKILKVKIVNKFVKLGDILIFSIQNNTNIINFNIEDKIDLKDFMDESLVNTNSFIYELFAIYSESKDKNDNIIRKCKIKINGIFYEIIDDNLDKIKNEQSEILRNLFYRKIK